MGIISIRGPAAGVVANIFREKILEDKEAKRVKKRVIVAKTRRTKIGKSNVWKCYLKCGHFVYRPIKRRRASMGQTSEDPAPAWVYCEECANA